MGNNSGAVVRATLTYHRCNPGSNPRVNTISVCCWFSPLLREVFSKYSGLSLSSKNCSNSNSIWNAQTRLKEVFFLFFFFFFSLLCEPGNRENRNAFYPHPACQVDKGRLPRHFSFRPSVTGCLNVKESGCTLHKPLTINRIFGIGIACRDCETGKISDGITGIQKPYWGWGLHMKVALEQKSDSLRSRA